MEATDTHNNVHDRLSAMKLRISSKKNAADMLFSVLGEPSCSSAHDLTTLEKQREDSESSDTLH